MPSGGTILLVEDEEDIASLVRAYLERDGFRVVWATRGTEGLAELERNDIRLAILDLQLPDADGFDVCRAIRSTSTLPVVMLTARDEEVDRVTGLELGADDYVTKPFSPRELAARVRAVLRRVEPDETDDRLSAGDVELDRRARTARRRGRRGRAHGPRVRPPLASRVAAGDRGEPRAAARPRVGDHLPGRHAHRGRPRRLSSAASSDDPG